MQDQSPIPKLSENEIEKLLAETHGRQPFPPAANREAWQGAAQEHPDLARLIRIRAEAVINEPLPPLSATLYLDFVRTGIRETYQEPLQIRRRRLGALVPAECFENRGLYMDAIMDTLWAILEESTWVMPAHGQGEDLPDPASPDIDLGAAMTSLQICEAYALLGEKLNPFVQRRIRYEIRQRIIDPYLLSMNQPVESENSNRNVDRWTKAINNWNAVCTGGVIGSALYMEPSLQPGVLAKMIEHAFHSLEIYLSGFDDEGGSSEGAGYWHYGFLWYTILADLLYKRFDGRIDLLAGNRIRTIARFPTETNMSGRRFVNFSDSHEEQRMEPGLLGYLAVKCDLPALAATGAQMPAPQPGPLVETLRNLYWPYPTTLDTEVEVPSRSYFTGMTWMIVRNGDLVLAVKGGNNGEMHNQNDVGNFIVHFRGESLVPDIGIGRYSKDYFGPNRYAILECSSRGHSVPLVNGLEQGTGKQFAAQVLSSEGDSLTLEMKDAYPAEANLESLVRTVGLHRSGKYGMVMLHDRYRFSMPGTFEEVIWTYATPEQLAPGKLMLHGRQGELLVEIGGQFQAAIEQVPPDAFSRVRDYTVYRLTLTPPSLVTAADVEITFTPMITS